MATILEKAGDILYEKQRNLSAEDIRKGKTIFGITGTIDLDNLVAENIKAGVVINGIEGTYTGE